MSIATPNHWHTLRPSGPARPARTSTSRSRARTTSSSRSRSSPPRASTTASSSRAARAAPHPRCREAVQRMREGEFGEVYMARGLCYKWRDTIGKTPVEPVPAGRRLRPLDRAGAAEAVHQESLPLQLALDLGHRQRRPRQPGHPRGGQVPLGPRRDAPDQGHRHRRQVHVRRRPGDAEHDHRRATSSTSTARRR